MNIRTYAFIITLLYSTILFGQEKSFKIPDSLKDMEYADLYKKHRKVKNDTTKSLIYIKTYLEKAKRDRDKITIARGYYLISHYETDDDRKLGYIDSSITISKDENDKYFPALAYYLKGRFYFKRWDYEKAFINYASAWDYAKKKENKNEEYGIKMEHNIGLIKSKIGKYDEALEIFKRALLYEKQRGIKDTMDYLISLITIADTYRKMKHIDSSSFYGGEGLLLSKSKDYDIYYEFLLNKGIGLYYKKAYTRAIDSISKSLPYLKRSEDKSSLVDAYFYLGKIYDSLKKTDKANAFYKKNDSIFQTAKKRVIPEIRESYESLIKYYEAKRDSQNELVYVKKLLEFDSILNADYKFLSEKIVKEYDTPLLLGKLRTLVNNTSDKNALYKDIIKVLTVAVFLILGLLYYQYKKRKGYQKRFENFIRSESNSSDNATVTDLDRKSRETLKIDDTIIEEVLAKLKKFEDDLGFLSSNVYRRNLAAKFGTNEKYISDIVNAYKKKSITRYINDLRIDYTVKRLQEDRKFMQYSIAAIAGEVGFNTQGAFKDSFEKNTGLPPSYFIKRLKKKLK